MRGQAGGYRLGALQCCRLPGQRGKDFGLEEDVGLRFGQMAGGGSSKVGSTGPDCCRGVTQHGRQDLQALRQGSNPELK